MADRPTIKLGSKGAAVTLAQRRLHARGYAIARDGIFDAQAGARVREYQTDRKTDTVAPLGVDGILGPKTWAPSIADDQAGCRGRRRELLQERLDLFQGNVDIDGVFGQATETALKEFQEFWGTLTVNGIAGPLTWTALELMHRSRSQTARASAGTPRGACGSRGLEPWSGAAPRDRDAVKPLDRCARAGSAAASRTRAG